MDGRHDGYAEVDRAAVDPDLEAAVLGNPLLGDVEFGHDLDPADDGLVVALVDRLHRLVQHAVDPVLDDDFLLARLDVDIRSAALDRIEQRRVDELDDGALVGRDPVDREHLAAVLVFLDELDLEVLGSLVEDPLRTLGLLQEILDLGPDADAGLEGLSELQFQFIDADHVRRIGHDDRQASFQLAFRDEAVAEHQVERDVPEEVVVDAEVLEIRDL